MTNTLSDELVEYHRSRCNRYVNGQCTTGACMKRGGWVGPMTVDYALATCEAHETVVALSGIERIQEEARKRDNRSLAWKFFDNLDGPLKAAFDTLTDDDKAEAVDQLEDAFASTALSADTGEEQ